MRTKKARDVQQRLEFEGWIWQRHRGSGSHRFFVHPVRPGTVTVPWHRNGQATLGRGTFGIIQKTAGWKQ